MLVVPNNALLFSETLREQWWHNIFHFPEKTVFNEQSNCGFRKNVFWGQNEYPVLWFCSEIRNCMFPREEVQEGHLTGKFQPSSVAQVWAWELKSRCMKRLEPGLDLRKTITCMVYFTLRGIRKASPNYIL